MLANNSLRVLPSLQSSVRYRVSTEAAASAGTSAGVRPTPRGSFATCRCPSRPDPPPKATRMEATRDPKPPRTPCTLCRCPISKVKLYSWAGPLTGPSIQCAFNTFSKLCGGQTLCSSPINPPFTSHHVVLGGSKDVL